MKAVAVFGIVLLTTSCGMPVRQADARGRPHGRVSADSIHRMVVGLPPMSVVRQRARIDSMVQARARAESLRLLALSDTFPDLVSYPATAFGEQIQGEEAAMLTSLAVSPSDFDENGKSFVGRKWYQSGPQSFLDSVLPGTRFLRQTSTDARYRPCLPFNQYFALLGGKLYGMDALNRLSLDAGFTFDSTKMPTIAKIAVLLATFGRAPDTSRPDLNRWQPTSSRGFPAITFLSVKRDTWHPVPSPRSDGIRVECLIDGVRKSIFVGFWGADKWGRRGVLLVNGDGLQLTPTTTRLPPRTGER